MVKPFLKCSAAIDCVLFSDFWHYVVKLLMALRCSANSHNNSEISTWAATFEENCTPTHNLQFIKPYHKITNSILQRNRRI